MALSAAFVSGLSALLGGFTGAWLSRRSEYESGYGKKGGRTARCALGAAERRQQERRREPVGRAAGRPRGLLEGHRRDRRQERSNVLGGIEARREFQAAGLSQAAH